MRELYKWVAIAGVVQALFLIIYVNVYGGDPAIGRVAGVAQIIGAGLIFAIAYTGKGFCKTMEKTMATAVVLAALPVGFNGSLWSLWPVIFFFIISFLVLIPIQGKYPGTVGGGLLENAASLSAAIFAAGVLPQTIISHDGEHVFEIVVVLGLSVLICWGFRRAAKLYPYG